MAHPHESGIIVKRSALFHYGVAAVSVAAATALRLALEPALGVYSPYVPFALAVIVASRFGGRGPGLVATALTLVAVPYFFLEPRYDIRVSDPYALPGMALFAVVGTIISFLIGQLRQSLVSSALNEERLRLAQTKAQMGIWDRNPRTGETTFTPELERAYGLDPGTIKTYEDWRRRVQPDDVERIEAARDEALARHRPFDFEYRVFHGSGEVRWFSASGGGVYDQAGNVVRVLGVNIDITERKRAEEALQQKTALVNFSHDAIIVADESRVIKKWNKGAEEIYGWTEAEAVGNVAHRFLRTESETPNAEVDAILAQRGRWDGELVHTRRDGKQIVVESRQILRRDAAAVPLGILEINRDITERKRAEEALQQKTELVNYSHDAIMTAGKNRVITTWNTGAEEIYGWTEAEAVGNVMHRLLHTGSPVSIDDIDRKLTRDGRWDGELVHTRRDGKQIIVESRQILRRDSAGVPIGILEINRDISDRKRLEDQFRQAQKLEGIGRLAGGVAHDFNNLLTVISGYSQTVLDEIAMRHPLREPIEQISKAAARATGLTRQLLIFSRSQVTEPSNFVLNDLVRDFEKMLRRLIGEDIDLVLALDPGAGTIRADAGQIEQVILNLAVNGRDAMPKGGTLSIETTSLLADEEFAQNHLSVQPGLYVVLVVSDTGVGMSPEVKSHLFEPFFTTKEAGKGTGLGLSTVYGIVKQSGGSIWVYSEPGRGTTFRILFPAVEVEAEPAPGAPVEAPSGSETILVAEDEADVCGFIRRTLERHGYTVLEASNGREALELARQHTGPIHLVMTDVVMPEMGGAEFADQFGAEHPGVPVLFMSGYTNHLGRRKEMGAGYLQKPFTSASLLTQVRAALDAV